VLARGWLNARAEFTHPTSLTHEPSYKKTSTLLPKNPIKTKKLSKTEKKMENSYKSTSDKKSLFKWKKSKFSSYPQDHAHFETLSTPSTTSSRRSSFSSLFRKNKKSVDEEEIQPPSSSSFLRKPKTSIQGDIESESEWSRIYTDPAYTSLFYAWPYGPFVV
jgi:hypothetical protein